jgi:hypothetical protein
VWIIDSNKFGKENQVPNLTLFYIIAIKWAVDQQSLTFVID